RQGLPDGAGAAVGAKAATRQARPQAARACGGGRPADLVHCHRNCVHRNCPSCMSMIVSRRAVADEVDMLLDDSWKAHINRRTGELFTVSPDDALAAEGDDDLGLPDWQREGLPKVREVLGSGDWLRLPSKFDIHEYNIMRPFCDEVDDGERREALQD